MLSSESKEVCDQLSEHKYYFVREKGVRGNMMSDLVTYCLVMWLAIIHVVRTKHHEWNRSDTKTYIPDRAQKRVYRLLESLRPNFNVNGIYRLKRNVLWDTS